MFPQALRAHSILGSPPVPPGPGCRITCPSTCGSRPHFSRSSSCQAPIPITFPQKTRVHFPRLSVPTAHPYLRHSNAPCCAASSRLAPCLLTSGNSRDWNRTYCCCQEDLDLGKEFRYKAPLSRCNFQPHLSSGFFPERKSRTNQRGRHTRLLFLCRAIQVNQFRVGLLVPAGVWNAGGFSAVISQPLVQGLPPLDTATD